MKLTWSNVLNDLCQEYMDSLEYKLKANHLPTEIRKPIESFFDYIERDQHETDELEREFLGYASRHNIRRLDALFDGDLKAIPLFLLGEKWTKLWNLYIEA